MVTHGARMHGALVLPYLTYRIRSDTHSSLLCSLGFLAFSGFGSFGFVLMEDTMSSHDYFHSSYSRFTFW